MVLKVLVIVCFLVCSLWVSSVLVMVLKGMNRKLSVSMCMIFLMLGCWQQVVVGLVSRKMSIVRLVEQVYSMFEVEWIFFGVSFFLCSRQVLMLNLWKIWVIVISIMEIEQILMFFGDSRWVSIRLMLKLMMVVLLLEMKVIVSEDWIECIGRVFSVVVVWLKGCQVCWCCFRNGFSSVGIVL